MTDQVADKKTALPNIKWDASHMRSTYANVCNVTSTREEVTLLFGIAQPWAAGQKELVFNLSDRILLNPYAAKRLLLLLNNQVVNYEKRFGEIKLDGAPAPESINH